MRNSKHTNPQIGYERTISRNKRYRFEGFALLAFAVLKSAFQLLAILAANRSASRILAQQWPNSRKAESREDKTAPNTPGRGDKTGGDKTGKGEVRLGRGAKRTKEKQTWQGDERGASLAGGQNGQGANSAGEGQSSMSDDLLSRLTAETWAAKKNEAGEEGSGFRKESRQVTGSWQPAPLFADPCKLRDSQFGEDSHFSFAIYPLSDS